MVEDWLNEDGATLDEIPKERCCTELTAKIGRNTNLKVLKVTDSTIDDNFFSTVSGLTTMKLADCDLRGVTDTGFRHLVALQALSIESCLNTAFTAKAFRHFRNIKELTLSFLRLTLTDEFFNVLKGIESLSIYFCDLDITDAAFLAIAGIQSLELYVGDNEAHIHYDITALKRITPIGFKALAGIKTLSLDEMTVWVEKDEFERIIDSFCLSRKLRVHYA